MVAFHGCLLDRAIHPFHLTVGPRVVGLRETVADAVLVADSAVKYLSHSSSLDGKIGWLLSDSVLLHHGTEHLSKRN